MSKPRLTINQYQQLMQLNKFHQAMNSQRRDSFFRGSAFVGGDPFADMKHSKAWFDYGYPMQIDFYMHWNMYKRNGLAAAGVNIPINLCWLDNPVIREGDDDEHEETQWELEVKRLVKRLKLFRHLKHADRMQRVGRYSAIFIRVRDGKKPDAELGMISADQIVQLQPIWEGQLEPNEIDEDMTSDRFGLPINYTYSATGTGNQNDKASQSFTIHHSRLITLSEDAIGGSIYGTPANEAGFNALLDWDKIRGSGGEASWLAAANKQILTPSQPGSNITAETLDGINDALKDMKEGLDEALFLSGVESTPMNNTVPDPEIYKQMAIEEYSASVGIPVKVMVGTQSGVKAGDEDTGSLMRLMQSRRADACSEYIERWLEWCYLHGVLVMPADGHSIIWSDLTAPTAMARAEFALKMTQAQSANMTAGDGQLFTGNEIRKEFGFEPLETDIEIPDETPPEDDSNV